MHWILVRFYEMGDIYHDKTLFRVNYPEAARLDALNKFKTRKGRGRRGVVVYAVFRIIFIVFSNFHIQKGV